MRYFLFFCTTLLFLGCESEEPEVQVGKEWTFKDWKQYEKLNLERFESASHKAFVDIYVDEKAKVAYENRAAEFPVGSKVLKPLFADKNQTTSARLTVMIKMEKGYDPKNNDWWYGVYDETGSEAWHIGKIESCIKCHALVKHTDYMFSESVMEEIEVQKGLRKDPYAF